MASRADLLNAFVPSRSQDDPDRFAGRAKEIKELADALQEEGSVPLIYGQRGLGKSSVAAQLSRIAQGDVTLLTEIDALDYAIPEEGRFITFYVTCEDSTGNLDGLLRLMINAVEALKHERAVDETKDEWRLVDKRTTKGISLKMFRAETVKAYERAVAERDLSGLSSAEKLVALTEALTDSYRQPVLFIIDEFDRLGSADGFASFLKSNSSTILKFAIVGIATTQSELLKDHESVHRQLAPVKIKPMKHDELVSIVDQTEEYLSDKSYPHTFSKEAKAELARLAAGFPWFVHVIGQRALLDAHDAKAEKITDGRIEIAVKKLAFRKMAQTYFDRYQTAVRDSAPRERVLRLFAAWGAENIPTSELYPMAQRIGVGAPANYLGHLTQEQCGFVLKKSPQQTRALYHFPDAMFKVYVRIRPSLYEGVDDAVDRVYEERDATK